MNLSEHVNTLFEGVESVTDEQKQKMETVLEAAVSSIVADKEQELQESFDQKVKEKLDEQISEIDQINKKYVDYVVSEWMEENKLALEAGIKLEKAQAFLDGMKELFVEHSVAVPEGKEDIVTAQEAKITELEEKLNESSNKVIELSNTLRESTKTDIISDVAKGLTDTQKEKFEGLVEGIEFGDAESYKSKVKTIRESYFKGDVQSLTEENSTPVKTGPKSFTFNNL